MALSKEELAAIEENSTNIYSLNITEFLNMLLEKATTWIERVS